MVYKRARALRSTSKVSVLIRCSAALVTLEPNEPVETVTIDDLPIGCAPRPRLQVVHDPATFAEAGKPVPQYRRSGRTKKGQHHALGSEWRLVPGHVGAK